MFSVDSDGKYTWVTSDGSGDCTEMNLSEIRKLSREGFLDSFGLQAWICWEFDSKGGRIGFKAGFNLTSPSGFVEEICIATARSKPKVYKTIEAACSDLIKIGFENARVDFG